MVIPHQKKNTERLYEKQSQEELSESLKTNENQEFRELVDYDVQKLRPRTKATPQIRNRNT